MKCCTSCNNCEPDTDEFIITDVLKDIDVNIPEEIVDSSEDEQYEIFDSESSLSSPARPILQVKPTLQTCSEVYFTGYLAKKCLSKFTCLECQLNLINSNKNLDNQQDLLIMYKTYGHVGPTQGLKAPSDNLLSISKICFEIFLNNYSHLKVGKNILNQLKEKSTIDFQIYKIHHAIFIIYTLSNFSSGQKYIKCVSGKIQKYILKNIHKM